jgi:oligopeptide/dipeptide ABC transporter ATP-binding protein
MSELASESSTPIAEPLLKVDDLAVTFQTRHGTVHAVDGVSFALPAGRALGIVGESGSGKSVTARSVMGVLPGTARQSGSIVLDGTQLIGLPESGFRRIRGAVVSMIFQDPMRSLNPTIRIGHQLAEAIEAHGGRRDRRATTKRAHELLELVRMPAATERLRSYPHELSGGMRQRVMIALALASNPRLLIADEPTTALDVTIQAQILDLIDDLRRDLGMALILVTHDLAVAAERTDEIAVMYAGRLVERAPTADLFAGMRMPYTRALVDSIPGPGTPTHSRLRAIPGRPPTLGGLRGGGCAFEPRCFRAAEVGDGRERCRSEAPDETGHGVHTWRCWHPLAAEPVTNLAVDVAIGEPPNPLNSYKDYEAWEAEAAGADGTADPVERTVDHG